MLGKTTNQILMKTEAAVSAKVPAALKGAFQKAVLAGEKIMYSPGGMKVFKEIVAKSPDIPSNVAEGAAKVMREMMIQSKMTISMKVDVPAATVRMCEGLDFVEKAGKIQVTNDVVAEATKDLGAYMMKIVGVTADKLNQMQQQKQQPAAKPRGILNQGA